MLRDGEFQASKALVIGGDQNGILAADWLTERGAEVWVAEAHDHFAGKLAGHDRWYLLNRLAAKPVHRLKNVRKIEVGGNDDVWLVTDKDTQMLAGIDTIVFASDRRAERGLAEVAEELGLDTIVVGDANDATSEHASTILATIQQSYDVARRI
jgi:NAD(P)H-nitrite reductase large subunit